ncbi:uncharacterized protein LOC132561343 [Ylistrum balloti]|uniref:uncharacterized protein LOC132561343 n=1 Tax=Ylistrum balloti TaxID=509963 RepID=UPI0029058EB8|nr:uncharacterized protein LOC132561343 [Ylistrum balloti]
MSTASFRRSPGFRNPDEDFVLHGRSSSFWEKPAYLTNSQITNSSTRLTSQHTMFNPAKYSDRHYVKSLGDIANNLGNLSANLDKSVSFSKKLQSKEFSNKSLTNFINTEDELSQLRSQSSDLSFRGQPLRVNENDWLNRSNSWMSQNITNKYKTSNPYKGEMDEEEEFTKQEKIEYPLSTNDSLSLRFFPVTMSAPYELSYLDINVPSTKKHSIRPKSAPRFTTSKPSKSQSKVGPFTRSDVDKMFLMSSEAPATALSSKVITSPYQPEIARLRMERLRIEQDRLLEMKRFEEIERIRGPNPRWYESKGPDFHYECSKNTELMKHENHWDELVDYRNSLLKSSDDFRKSYETFA